MVADEVRERRVFQRVVLQDPVDPGLALQAPGKMSPRQLQQRDVRRLPWARAPWALLSAAQRRPCTTHSSRRLSYHGARLDEE